MSTATVLRYLNGHEAVQPKTLDRITSALDLPSAVPVTGSSGEWAVNVPTAGDEPGKPQESGHVVVDGDVVIALRMPRSFWDRLPEDEQSEIIADATVHLMQLSREAARRERSGNGGT